MNGERRSTREKARKSVVNDCQTIKEEFRQELRSPAPYTTYSQPMVCLSATARNGDTRTPQANKALSCLSPINKIVRHRPVPALVSHIDRPVIWKGLDN